MAYIGRGLDKISNVEVLDNLTFDGSSTSFTLQKGGSNFTPSSANNILVSIDGVVQAGNFTCSGSTIDFGVAVSASSTCNFIIHYGVGVATTPSDGSVTTVKLADSSVTSAKLSSGAISLSGGGFKVEDGYAYGFGDNSYRIEGKDDGANARIGFVTSGSEIARFTANGLTFNGDTAAANALDDYEEGTWTPTISTTGTDFSSITYNDQLGSYTKVGRTVTAHFQISITAITVGSPSGNLTVKGLPFTALNNSLTKAGMIAYVNNLQYALPGFSAGDDSVNVSGNVGDNTTQFNLSRSRDNDGADGIPYQALTSTSFAIVGTAVYDT